MGRHRTSPVWLWILVAAVTLVVMWPERAFAAAPICDDRAASAIAPPPVLPLRDTGWDVEGGSTCFTWPPPGVVLLEADHSRVPAREAGGPNEGLAGAAAWSLAPPSSRADWIREASVAGPPGYRTAVFRPPRSFSRA